MGLKKVGEKIILIIVTLSLLLTFVVAPSSYAKLTLKDGEFYYAGTTKGTYTASEGIFSWLLNNLSQIADWLVGIMTLGPRMVFVGWTALIERMLTWTLETTTGVNINGDGVNSATDLSSITDSSSNITVQAIVYNQVPAFDINFFDIEYDPTVSGTGQIYKCDTCNKECSECCTSSESCSCKCNGNCDACKAYMAALATSDELNGEDVDENRAPVVIQLKRLVATWYYVLRLLSIAAMLIVLIGIGIKMAISTIASEKAVYKRMLADWLAGLIILVSVHYIMWFIIQINDTLVGVVKDSANSINQVQLKQLYDKNDAKGEKKEVSNEEIEISVYEEIRTRAYDPKLSVGLSGMLMYMTLVYFAIRYSLVYLKRFLTMVVLTLMGPPVGVAYALQKAISGKSSTFKAWLTEYVMNVIIQTVHALIYAIFISQALVLSLQSVAGMIVALIFMNFALKAEKLFKQIFKMSSEGSLLENAEQAGDAEKIKSNFQAARGLYMGAKPVAGALMNTPFAKAVKGAGKIGLAGAGYIAGKTANKLSGHNDDESDEHNSENPSNTSGNTQSSKSNNTGSNVSLEDAERDSSVSVGEFDSTKKLMIKGEDQLRRNVASKWVAYEDAPADKKKAAEGELNIAMGEYTKHKALGLPTTKDIIKGHAERIVDVENHFELTYSENGGKVKKVKDNVSSFMRGAFGTEHYDSQSGKWVSDGNAFYQQFNSKNLLGFTDADKKIFKEQVLNPIRNGFGGMATMFLGLGTLVAHPSFGMSMLAGGVALTGKTFRKPTNSKKYKGKYSFSRFSVPAMSTIQKEVNARADREMNAVTAEADSQMVQRIASDHPELYSALKEDIHNDVKSETFLNGIVKDLKVARNSGIAVATLGVATGAGICAVPAATIAAGSLFAARFIAKSGISSNIEAIQKHSVKQARDQQLGFIQDGMNEQSAITQEVMKDKAKKQDEEYMREVYEDLGFDYNPETGEPIEKSDTKKAQEDYNKEMIAIYATQGLKYDPKNGTLTPLTQEEKKESRIEDKFVDSMQVKDNKNQVNSNSNEILVKEMDAVIDELVNKYDGKLDMNSQEIQNEAMTMLSNRLATSKIIQKNQKVEDVYKGGKNKLVLSLKARADNGNAEHALSIKDAAFSDEDKAKIKEVAAKIAMEKGNDYSQVKVSEVLSIVSKPKEKKNGSEPKQSPSTPTENKGETKGNNEILQDMNVSQAKEVAVTNYLKYMQKIQPTQPTKAKSISEAKRIANGKMQTRKRKLQQILSLDIEENSKLDNTTDEAIVTASDIKNGSKKSFRGKNGETITLEKSEATDVLELLLMRKELEQINLYAEKELEVKKGSSEYNDSVKKKSQSAIDYYRAQLEIEKMKQADPTLSYSKEKVASIKNTNERKAIELKQANLLKNIEKLKKFEQEKIEAEKAISSKGPIINVDEFIGETFGNKGKKNK